MRLFIAIMLPDELKEGISRILDTLMRGAGKADADVKWVKPDQFHLTLQFLGECTEDQLPAIESRLASAMTGFSPFKLTLGGLGCFPKLGSPKVLWMGVLEGAEPAQALAGRVQSVLEPLGFAAEEHQFHTHLTLGRARTPWNMNKVRAWMESQKVESVGGVAVDSIALIQSFLSPKGPTYKELRRFTFGADGGTPLPGEGPGS